MTLSDYVAATTGQSLLYPPNTDEALRGQCVQLVEFYARDFVGRVLPLLPTAKDYYRQIDGYTLVANSPDPNNVPQPGDIVIWGAGLPGSLGAGHIAICLSAVPGAASFTSFDSNWGGKTAHQVVHNWSYVLGWLHPNNQGGNMSASAQFVTQAFQAILGRDPSSGDIAHYTSAQYGDPAFALNDIFNSAEGRQRRANLVAQAQQVSQLSGQVAQLQEQLTALEAADKTASLQAQLDDANKKLSDQAKQIADLTLQLASVHNNQPVSSYSAVELIVAGLRKFLRIDQ